MNAVQTSQPVTLPTPQFEATELTPSTPQHWLPIAGLAGAAILLVSGVVILVKVRRAIRNDYVQAAKAGRFSPATRALAAMACLICGYLLVAWNLDERIMRLHAPVQPSWLVPLVAVFVVAASCGVDLFQRRFDVQNKN